ncbi:MAG: type II secretion system protein [Planctomycetota bacterium]|jgi:prepilin-type N-terminal cleavage/methylation domain-containing protein
MKRSNHRKKGFTLMEIAVTAVILLVLAGMAVPAFSDSIGDAEVASAQSMLSRMRTGVDFYSLQHRDNFPGEGSGGTWSTAILDNQLRMASDLDGNTAAHGTAGYPYGPYMTESIPANPFNGLTSVTLIQPGGSFLGPDDTSGWVYWADTGALKINSTVIDKNGDAVYDL